MENNQPRGRQDYQRPQPEEPVELRQSAASFLDSRSWKDQQLHLRLDDRLSRLWLEERLDTSDSEQPVDFGGEEGRRVGARDLA